jgi:hypothetical protein
MLSLAVAQLGAASDVNPQFTPRERYTFRVRFHAGELESVVPRLMLVRFMFQQAAASSRQRQMRVKPVPISLGDKQ